MKSPITNISKPDVLKVLIASFGVQTIGSPFKLKDVFIISGIE